MKTLRNILILLLVQACGENPFDKPSRYDPVRFQPDKATTVTSANASTYDTPDIPYFEADESIPHCGDQTEGEIIYWAKPEAYYNCLKGAWVRIPHPEE